MQLGLQNYQVISINNIEYTNRVRICWKYWLIVCLLLDLLWKMVHAYSIQDKSNVKQIYRNEEEWDTLGNNFVWLSLETYGENG